MSDISKCFSYCVFILLSLRRRRFWNLFKWKNILVSVLVIMTKQASTSKKNDVLIYFNFVLVVSTLILKGHGFASLFVPFPFLNYLKLLLPGILTLFLIAGCNFKCISSKNIPKPTQAAIKPTSLCIFLQLLTKSGFGCKFGERFQKTFDKPSQTPTSKQHAMFALFGF